MGDAPAPSPDSFLDTIENSKELHLLTTGPFALALNAILAAGFLAEITRYHYWGRSRLLQVLLSLAKSPLVYWFGQFQAFILATPYGNELYLVWGVLLLTGYGSFHSMLKYSIYTSNKKKLMLFHEKIQLLNSFGILVLLFYYTLLYTKFGIYIGPYELLVQGNFGTVLWLIWGFSIIKILYQITSYYYVDCSYGSMNTKWVSFYMKSHENTQYSDPKDITGYRYLLLEEKPPVISKPNYEIVIDKQKLVTIEDVWQSKGRLLNSGSDKGEKLKDVCLSFALFKMLKRRFIEQCETAEANWPETRDFIRQRLIESSGGESNSKPSKRIFKIIDLELRFLRDLFYTKNPTVLGLGLPIYILLFSILFTSFFGIFLRLNQYIPPPIDTHHALDLVVTKVILFTVMVIEVWEFVRYIFSDWAKVLLVCNYVKKTNLFYHLVISMVLWVVRSIHIPGQTVNEIGQYSLLKYCKRFRFNRGCRENFFCLQFMDRVRGVKYVKFNKEKVMEAILPSLKQFLDKGFNHPAGTITAFSYREINEALPSWAFEVQDPIQRLMIWHVATNFCWMITKKKKPETKGKRKTSKPVAVTLSNYCAYLVVHAPELLPINSYITELILEQIIHDTRKFFTGVKKSKMVEKMQNIQDKGETVICRGAILGNMLKNAIQNDEHLWDFLKEVWAGMMLQLAPSETSVAHATKLAEGSEFMTYLWVLLYHAGFPDQASFNGYGSSAMI